MTSPVPVSTEDDVSTGDDEGPLVTSPVPVSTEDDVSTSDDESTEDQE